jgi:hypothetical protein
MNPLIAFIAFGAAPVQAPAQAAELPTLVWSDFDRDGYEDALALHAGTLSLFRNAATGHEDECAAAVGLDAVPPLSAAGWIDFDRDGAPDVFGVTTEGAPLLLRNESGLAFHDLTSAAGLTLSEPILRAEWTDIDADGEPDLVAWTPGAVQLFRNVGGAFESSELTLSEPTTPGAPAAMGFGTAPATEAGGALETAPEEGPRRVARSGGRTVVEPPVGSNPMMGPGAASTTSGLTPPRTIGMAIPKNCAKFVYDEKTQNCIVTSTVPAIGQLYPLSNDFNVASNGNVGMGISTPISKLHIASGTTEGLRIVSGARAASLFSTDASAAALRVESAGYAGFIAGRLEVGYEQNNFPFFFDRARVVMDVDANNAGLLDIYNGAGQRTVRFESEEFADNGAQLDLATNAGVNTITFDAENSSFGGLFSMRMANGTETVQLIAEEAASNGAQLTLRNAAAGNTMVLDANTSTGGGEFSMHMFNGVESVEIKSEESAGNGGQILMRNGNGTTTMVLDANTQATGGSLFEMFALNGQETVEITADEVLGNGAQIVLRKYDGTATIVLDADQGGDGRITTQELAITGGADLVESFDTGDVVCEPGTVVVIDTERPGELKPSTSAYDVRVAGVVSGAGGVKPGIHMGQDGVASGSTPVALTGRVYVRCTNENGPIRPGDLLTSSSTTGCAMRATDVGRSFGTVIGKAMTVLDGEAGLVLTLVNLQ